jgi:hypothetical protein
MQHAIMSFVTRRCSKPPHDRASFPPVTDRLKVWFRCFFCTLSGCVSVFGSNPWRPSLSSAVGCFCWLTTLNPTLLFRGCRVIQDGFILLPFSGVGLRVHFDGPWPQKGEPMFATRIAKYARHAASFMLHFAHGGLLVAGLIVTLFMWRRVSPTMASRGFQSGSLMEESAVVCRWWKRNRNLNWFRWPTTASGQAEPRPATGQGVCGQALPGVCRGPGAPAGFCPADRPQRWRRPAAAGGGDGHRVPLQSLCREPDGRTGADAGDSQVAPGQGGRQVRPQPPCSIRRPTSASVRWCSRSTSSPPDRSSGLSSSTTVPVILRRPTPTR